jgi:hypothetical protein
LILTGKSVPSNKPGGALYVFTLRLKLRARVPENMFLEREKYAATRYGFLLMHYNLISYSFRGFM